MSVPADRTNPLLGAALLIFGGLASLGVAGCGQPEGLDPGVQGEDDGNGAGQGSGSDGIVAEVTGFALSVEMAEAADVAGFDVRVRRVACQPGEVVPQFEAEEHVMLAGNFVPGEAGDLVNAPFAAGSEHPAADQFFTVAAGCYSVSVTPVTAAGTASEDCLGARVAEVVVHDGETTEITVVIQCEGEGVGGLDVIVVVNRPPFIKHVEYRPSKLTPACEPVMICASATDPDGDPIDIVWEHTAGAPFSVGPEQAFLDGGPGEVTSCVQVVGSEPAYHLLTVRAYDMAWHNGQPIRIEELLALQGEARQSNDSLEMPLHVGSRRHGEPSCDSPPEPPCNDRPHNCHTCPFEHHDCGECDLERDRLECRCPNPTSDCTECDPNHGRYECRCPHPTSDCGECDPRQQMPVCACEHETNDCGACDSDDSGCPPVCNGPTTDCGPCDPAQHLPICTCEQETNDCGECDSDDSGCPPVCIPPSNDCGPCDPQREMPVCTCDHDTDDCGECDLDDSGCPPVCDDPTDDCGDCDPRRLLPICTCVRDTNDCGACDFDDSGCGPVCDGGDLGPDGDCDSDGVPTAPRTPTARTSSTRTPTTTSSLTAWSGASDPARRWTPTRTAPSTPWTMTRTATRCWTSMRPGTPT